MYPRYACLILGQRLARVACKSTEGVMGVRGRGSKRGSGERIRGEEHETTGHFSQSTALLLARTTPETSLQVLVLGRR